jgi:hypothetical protein|tara:strand:- start:426 stop:1025 length:600 start_codon:yes stop_codon:yes gene_type:complete
MNTYERIKQEYSQYSEDICSRHIILDRYMEKFSIPRDGYWFEFGVHTGATINTLSSFCDKIYGFDSFEGLPEYWDVGYPKGKFKLNTHPKVKDNVELVVGWFDETLPKFIEENNIDKINFINIDCDLYQSTKTVFKNLGKYIRPGTYIYFDEFLVKTSPIEDNNEAKAFAEFLDEYNLDYDIISSTGKNWPIQTLVKIK